MRRARGLPLVALAVSAPGIANADASGMFGPSPASAGLARADLTTASPADAPRENAAIAATPGLRLQASYGYRSMGFTIDGRNAGVESAGATDFAAQFGRKVSHDVTLGFAAGLHFPDGALAKVAFRPATEPQFVLYEAPLERAAVDVVGAVRWKALSLGGGVAAALDVGGKGTRFELGRDGRGTFADADLNVALTYRFAPIVGLRAELGRVALGAAFRGPLALGLELASFDTIDLQGNPLDGTTTVRVRGTSGYDPARIDAGGSVDLPLGLRASAALELAAWEAAPPPVADVLLDVRLGTTPSQTQAHFVEPRFRNTLSGRAGLELRGPRSDAAPEGSDETAYALRAGYAFSPTPVPRQTGFTSYADGGRHTFALGGGVVFGTALGITLRGDVAGQLHFLATHPERKPDASLPHARYTPAGSIAYGTFGLGGTFR